MSRSHSESIDRLLRHVLDEQLTASEEEELEKLLVERPEVRQAYLDFAFLDSYLDQQLRSQHVISTLPWWNSWHRVHHAWGRAAEVMTRRIALSLLIAASVIGLLIGALAVVEKPMDPPVASDDALSAEEQPIARVTGMHDARWEEGFGAALHVPQVLPGRRLRLRSGFAELTYSNGVVVTLEGPCEYIVSTPRSGELVVGKLAARVGPAGRGFIVDTPTTQVVDLGTEFGVEVADTEAGDVVVHVMEGVVEVSAIASSVKASVRVTAGTTAKVDGKSFKIARTPTQDHRFTRALPESASKASRNHAARQAGGRVSASSAADPASSPPEVVIDEREKTDPEAAYRWYNAGQVQREQVDAWVSQGNQAGEFWEVAFANEVTLQRIEIQGLLDYRPGSLHSRHQNLEIELFDGNHQRLWSYVDSVGRPYSGVSRSWDQPPTFGVLDLTSADFNLNERQRTAKFLRITQTQEEALALCEVRAFGPQPEPPASEPGN